MDIQRKMHAKLKEIAKLKQVLFTNLLFMKQEYKMRYYREIVNQHAVKYMRSAA